MENHQGGAEGGPLSKMFLKECRVVSSASARFLPTAAAGEVGACSSGG